MRKNPLTNPLPPGVIEQETLRRGLSAMGVFTVLRTLLMCGLALMLLSVAGMAETVLVTDEVAVTDSPESEVMPVLGTDAEGDYVVYTRHVVSPTGAQGIGSVYYQRLQDGLPLDAPVAVADDVRDNRGADASGDYIAYTSYESLTSAAGEIRLYQISTATTWTLDAAPLILYPSISGSTIAWREGTIEGTLVWHYDLSWLETDQQPEVIAGPLPPSAELDVDDQYLAWSATEEGRYDIFVHELATGTTTRLLNTLSVSERQPAIDYPWVAFREQDIGTLNLRIGALNLETGEYRSVADNGQISTHPRISGNLVSYESSPMPVDDTYNYDIFVYRLDEDDTFQVTDDIDRQWLADILGSRVAYTSYEATSWIGDIFTTSLAFVVLEPDIEVTPSDFNFGTVETGTSSTALFTVSNLGSDPLNIEQAEIVDGALSAYTLTAPTTFPVLIAPGNSIELSVVFTPLLADGYTGVLRIVSNDEDEPEVLVEMKGLGADAVVPPEEMIEASLEFIETVLATGDLFGEGPGKSAGNRADALVNMLEEVEQLAAEGDITAACTQLDAIYLKVDGLPRPPDFVAGPARDELATKIYSILTSLNCP